MFAKGFLLILVDVISSLLPPEGSIPILACIGIIFGFALVKGKIEGIIGGIALGAIMGALGEMIQAIPATSFLDTYILHHVLGIAGLLTVFVGTGCQK